MKDIERQCIEACRHARATKAFGTGPQRSDEGAYETPEMRKLWASGTRLLLKETEVDDRNER
jgi:hypothetical protein